MTKYEAIQAMIEGKKVTHRFFLSNEFIYMENGMIFFENEIPAFKFWQYRDSKSWDIDWSIYK